MLKFIKVLFITILFTLSSIFLIYIVIVGITIENDNMIKWIYWINYPKIVYSEYILSKSRWKEEVKWWFGQEFRRYKDDEGAYYYVADNGWFLENVNVLIFNPDDADIRWYATFKYEHYFECSEKSDRCVINWKLD